MTADGHDREEGAVMWRERITPADLESRHFASQLLERLGWAVNDADCVDNDADCVDDDADCVETVEVSQAEHVVG